MVYSKDLMKFSTDFDVSNLFQRCITSKLELVSRRLNSARPLNIFPKVPS